MRSVNNSRQQEEEEATDAQIADDPFYFMESDSSRVNRGDTPIVAEDGLLRLLQNLLDVGNNRSGAS